MLKCWFHLEFISKYSIRKRFNLFFLRGYLSQNNYELIIPKILLLLLSTLHEMSILSHTESPHILLPVSGPSITYMMKWGGFYTVMYSYPTSYS